MIKRQNPTHSVNTSGAICRVAHAPRLLPAPFGNVGVLAENKEGGQEERCDRAPGTPEKRTQPDKTPTPVAPAESSEY